MAAEAALSAFLQVLFEKLASLALKKSESLTGNEKELAELPAKFSKIRAVLNDAEEKQDHNEAVRMWLKGLKDVAYDMEDILDELATEAMHANKASSSNQTEGNVVSALISYFPPDIFHYGLARKVDEINKRLDEIAKEKESLNLREVHGGSPTELSRARETSSLVDESKVIGRGRDVEKIAMLLLADESCSGTEVTVFPIVGMGGIGKTTLAQLVYKDEMVQSNFEPRIWVHVSENFDVKRITRAIIESATGKRFELSDLDSLHVNLKRTLEGKRFFLVLDDLWNENIHEWEKLTAPLIGGGKGSTVLITTRSEAVARISGTVASYYLASLSDEDCWVLFKQCAFRRGSQDANPKLESTGKEIVKKLKGLPLAAKALGGLLCTRKHEEEWNMILKSEIWELTAGKNDILPALKLSYHHLPALPKLCFQYLSVFPKGYLFEKEKLVQLWIAQGLIQPPRVGEMEEVGGDCFNDLLYRSFFQRCKFHKSKFVMHDLIHDLVRSITADETILAEDDKQRITSKTVRHASVTCDYLKAWGSKSFHEIKSLRTLVVRCVGESCTTPPFPRDLFTYLTSLRVLDLSKSCITDLPSSIGYLKSLRLFDLSDTSVRMLPESLINLYNLQTLKLSGCNNLHELPRHINRLINLRHLEVKRDILSRVVGIGKLTSLQKLALFEVQKSNNNRITELKDLAGLKGSLCISKLENVVSEEEASMADMRSKQHIRSLELSWSREAHEGNDVCILQALEPHHNLEGLTIKSYNGSKFPTWLQSPQLFSHLAIVSLFNCSNCEILPPLGLLPFLTHLIIRRMPRVTKLGHEFSGSSKGFRSLEKLWIYIMPELKEWCGLDGGIPCLKRLLVSECPKLVALPKLPPTLEKLYIHKCPELSCVPGSFPSLSLLNLWRSNEIMLSSMLRLPLPSLSMLQLTGFPELAMLQRGWLQDMTALKQLTIRNLNKLASLSSLEFEFIAHLKHLKIEGCPELTSLLDEAIPPSLEELEVLSCHHLESLLGAVGQASVTSSLRRLQIADCPKLESLPVGLKNLTSLNQLHIVNCPQIPSLPPEPLPLSVRRLTIKDCSLLKERCQKVQGEDWHKICHISIIRIDDQSVISIGEHDESGQ